MRIIAHLDMDAFFASVEERDKPYLKGMPISVGSDPSGGKGRGVVSTANYLARGYGIHSALPITQAWKLSEEAKKRGLPAVIFIEPNHGKYEKVSERIMKIVRENCRFSDNLFGRSESVVEQVSVDECYMDLSFAGSYEVAGKIVEKIRKEIKEKESLTSSVGIGPNKLVAKVASDYKKPNSLTVVRDEDKLSFLAQFGVRKIPGIGPQMERRLLLKKIKSVKDLQNASDSFLADLGKSGKSLKRKALGEDDSVVMVEPNTAISIGEQETFGKDISRFKEIMSILEKISERVFKRFKADNFNSFRTVVLTVRFSDFETKQRSVTSTNSWNSEDSLKSQVIKLILPFIDGRENPFKKDIRLLGVRLEKLL